MRALVRAKLTQCDGKKSYATWADAVKWRRKMHGLEAYRCPHCRLFHLGNKLKGLGRPKPPPPPIELEFDE